MNMETHASGLMVKNHISSTENFVPVVVPGLPTTLFKLVYLNIHYSFKSGNWSFRSPLESSKCMDRQVGGDPFTSKTEELLHEPTKIPKPYEKDHEHVRGDPCSDTPEWLQ